MSKDIQGASPTGDRAVVNGAGQAVSALRASVPSAANVLAADRALLLQALYGAKLQLEYLDSRWPTGTTPVEITRIEAVLKNALPWEAYAQAIEARRAETAQQAPSQDESAVHEVDAPND